MKSNKNFQDLDKNTRTVIDRMHGLGLGLGLVNIRKKTCLFVFNRLIKKNLLKVRNLQNIMNMVITTIIRLAFYQIRKSREKYFRSVKDIILSMALDSRVQLLQPPGV